MSGYGKMPALLAAAYKGHLDIVQMLLESGKVDVNQKDSEVTILLYHTYIYLIFVKIICIDIYLLSA